MGLPAPARERPRRSFGTGVALALALGAVALAAGCSSGGRTVTPSSTSNPASSGAPGGTDSATSTLALDGGHVLGAAEVTCHLAKREQGGMIGTDDGRVETSCTERHNEESFTLSGTSELDDCYRAVAASSDVAIGPDSFDTTKLEFADERIMGHTFATTSVGAAGPGGVSCAIDLRDDRPTPLLAGSP